MSKAGKTAMRDVGAILLILGLLAGITGSVQATPIPVDGGWQYPYDWYNAPGAPWVDGPFTYDSGSSWTSLKVTDYYVAGDQFEVYDWGSLLGTTSYPSELWYYTTNIDLAYADPRWSSGEFLLEPGAHSITLMTIRTAPLTSPGAPGNVNGWGALRVDTSAAPVPVPGAVVLGMIGLSMVGWVGRRRLA